MRLEDGTEIKFMKSTYLYGNQDRMAICADDAWTGEPYADLTVNIPDAPLGAGCVFLSNDCEDVLDILLINEFLIVVGYVHSGYATYREALVSDKFLAIMGEY